MASTPQTKNQDNQVQNSAVQSLLAGLNQPLLATPQYVPPVQQNTSKWSRIITGALSGLGGGLEAGLQNIQDAGTPRGPHANGYDAGARQYQAVQDQQAQQQAQATQQAQQDYQNKMQSAQFTTEQQLNKARMMSANLNNLKLAMAIDNAPKEAQDAYYADQDAHAAALRKEGMSELTEVPDLNSLAQWSKQAGKTSADYVVTHHQDADGKDRLAVWENPDHQVDAPFINKGLRGLNYPEVPAGATMSYADYHALRGRAQSAYADQLNKQQQEQQRAADEMARTKYTQGQENARQSRTLAAQNASKTATDPNLVADAVANGKGTFEQLTGGMGKEAATFRRQVEQAILTKYPNVNLGVLKAQSKLADSAQFQGSLNTARSLFGSGGQEGSLDVLEKAIRAVPKAPNPYLAKLRQNSEYQLGSPAMAEVKALKTDLSTELAKFNTGNGAATSDHQIEQYREQLNEAQTPEQVDAVLKGIRQVSAMRLHGLVGQNVFAREMSKDINNPEASNRPGNVAPEGTRIQMKNGSGFMVKQNGKWVKE